MSYNLVDPTTGDLTRVAGETLWADSPIGSILPYGGTSAPSGWMICDGSALSRTTYSELFAVIGTSFGSGDGSTTFNIPDLRGEFLRGAGTNGHSNQGNGGTVGQHQDATELPNMYMSGSTGATFYGALNANKNNIDSGKHDGTGYSSVLGTSSAQASFMKSYTTRPTNTSVNYIIKAKMCAMPSDFMSKVDEAVGEFLNHKSANITVTFSGSATISKDVTFDTPMPDTNYVVIFEGTYGNEQVLYPLVVAKSVNGFTVKITKTDETTSGTYAIKYHAFRIA